MSSTSNLMANPVIRILQHLTFWVLAFFVFLHIFKTGPQPETIDYVYTLLFHLTLIPAVYINLEWLLPRTTKKRNLAGYAMALIALVLIFSWINYQFFQQWSNYLLPDFYFISYLTFTEVCFFFITYIALTTLLKLSKSWFTVSALEKKLLETEKEKVQIELRALRSQINPHFFFNTLNSIYSMALEKDDRLPATVLQLSDLMRYFLYESRGESVPLGKEIELLQHYIALQKLRSANTLETITDINVENDSFRIAPLLLITFVENAFKHGAKGNTGRTFVHLALTTEGDELRFHLANNRGAADDSIQNDHKGVGLENVKRRLELLYPGRHRLKTGIENNSFVVELYLQMQQHV